MGCSEFCRAHGHTFEFGCVHGTHNRRYQQATPVTTGQYRVVASIPFEYPGELYSETFIMEGKSEADIRQRVNLLLADKRYLIAIRKV